MMIPYQHLGTRLGKKIIKIRVAKKWVGSVDLSLGIYKYSGQEFGKMVWWPTQEITFSEEEWLAISALAISMIEHVEDKMLARRKIRRQTVRRLPMMKARAGRWIETSNGRRWAVPMQWCEIAEKHEEAIPDPRFPAMF